MSGDVRLDLGVRVRTERSTQPVHDRVEGRHPARLPRQQALDLMPKMRSQLSAWLRSGELVHRDTVFDGLDQASRALSEMLAGRTTGKTLVSIR